MCVLESEGCVCMCVREMGGEIHFNVFLRPLKPVGKIKYMFNLGYNKANKLLIYL